MPPKTKFTKEAIIEAAYEILEEKGVRAITARDVGKKLGSTTAPIFTYFKNMDELIDCVYNHATDKCEGYLNESINYTPMFKEFGLRWIRYAKRHPNAYKYIFMYHGPRKKSGDIINIEFIDVLEPMIDEISKTFDISEEKSKELVNMACIYAQGIASLCVNGIKTINEEEISKQLSILCISLVSGFKTLEGNNDNKKIEQMFKHINDMPTLKKEI